jgi:anaerobic ribonucleoside-triphosphate reductase activating protein
MKVRIAGFLEESITDGPGLRITLFFQGCEHHCQGCHNPQTWDRSGGQEYELDDLLEKLNDFPLIRGITLSGGEPFLQPQAAMQVARAFKSRGKDVWGYTGFVWEELTKNSDPAVQELIRVCDVIVDGPYRQSLRDLNLTYRGSANQRLIAVKESLEQERPIEWNP